MASGRTGGAQGVNRRCADAPKRASCQLLLSPLRRLVEREVQRDPAAEHRGRERDVSNPPAISDSRSMNQEATITTSAGPNLTTGGEHAEVKGLLEPGPGHAPHSRLSEAPSFLSHARRALRLQHVFVVPQDRVDVELGRAVAAFAEARR